VDTPVPTFDPDERDDDRGQEQPVPVERYLEPLFDKPELDVGAPLGTVGRTMFDSSGSEDGSITVLLPKDEIDKVPTQALVRIDSQHDKRTYLAIVIAGPFAEPDGLRADANVIVTTTVRGGIFMPRYHGRVQVEILGEELDGHLFPPRFRPLPNSPVTVLSGEEKHAALQCAGSLQLGPALGDEELLVGIPAERKSVLPRHTAVLGTTGGGKSTTVGRLLAEAQRANMAVVLLDTEGEYVHIGEPTDDQAMLTLLARRGIEPAGIPNTRLYHLVGTETANPDHPQKVTFGLRFDAIAPRVVAEIVGMSEAQEERFFRTIDVGKQVLRELKIFPRERNQADEDQLLNLNEFEEGYPQLTLSRILDLATAMRIQAEHGHLDVHQFYEPLFNEDGGRRAIKRLVGQAKPSHPVSWQALLARLWRLHRFKIFDQPKHPALDTDAMRQLLTRGGISIIDLSGTDSTELNNIVIADLLRRIQSAQDDAYRWWEKHQHEGEFRRVLLVIEEAHEFLSKDRITKLDSLYQQVARIARRGRKRWLGLVFVTQLPQHLPREVLGLVNNYVLHKINDDTVVRALKDIIPGIDASLWRRLPALAPGQAIVSFTHMTRPLLIAVDPSGSRLRMVE
jgi:DNA helicase HerA-like ATPase